MSFSVPSTVASSRIERRMLRYRSIFLSISTHWSHISTFHTERSHRYDEQATVLFQGDLGGCPSRPCANCPPCKRAWPQTKGPAFASRCPCTRRSPHPWTGRSGLYRDRLPRIRWAALVSAER